MVILMWNNLKNHLNKMNIKIMIQFKINYQDWMKLKLNSQSRVKNLDILIMYSNNIIKKNS